MRARPIGWVVPFAVMVVAVIAVALASPGVTAWLLWPVLAAAVVSVVAIVSDILRRRPRHG